MSSKIKFAVDFVSLVKEATNKDLAKINDFENSWKVCSKCMSQLNFIDEHYNDVINLINILKDKLKALHDNPFDTLLETSENSDDGVFSFYFIVDSSDYYDWSNTILHLAGNSLDVLRNNGVNTGWSDGNGPNQYYSLDN